MPSGGLRAPWPARRRRSALSSSRPVQSSRPSSLRLEKQLALPAPPATLMLTEIGAATDKVERRSYARATHHQRVKETSMTKTWQRFQASQLTMVLGGLSVVGIVALAVIAALVLRQQEIEVWRNQMSNNSLLLSEHTYQTMTSSYTALVLNKDTGTMKADRVIVLEFNSVTVGVLVHSVSRIYRISWRNVEPPSRLVEGAQVTGMVKMDDRIILVLDFEKIVGELCQDSALRPMQVEQLSTQESVDRSGHCVLVADDSAFIRNIMVSALRGAGYQVEEATDGEEAWEMIRARLTESKRYDLLITDVEMPQMDGLHLTSLVRKEEALAGMPVVIFSSLASDGNRRKWINLGANQILTKPELPRLVEVAGELIGASTA